MARESKQKRDEKRFGKPERLADKILGGDYELGYPAWSNLPPADLKEWVHASEAACRETIAACPVVVADNVAEYYFGVSSKMEFDYMTDSPNCRPPFPRMFVEFRRPQWFRDANGVRPFGNQFPELWGQIVDTLPTAELPRRTGHPVTDEGLLPMLDLPDVAYILRFVEVEIRRNVLLPGAITGYLPITAAGAVLAPIKLILSGSNVMDRAKALEVIDNRGQFFHCGMLTFSFMNCKNVTTRVVDPEPGLNRKRLRANLEPFLRYHTIVIEPMKQVLRTEGGVEANGLAKALHICRGHFATYTADHPLFGHFVGTVWKPAHVRGSAKMGVVVADYRVFPPTQGG
jgi:hypothetical protein